MIFSERKRKAIYTVMCAEPKLKKERKENREQKPIHTFFGCLNAQK